LIRIDSAVLGNGVLRGIAPWGGAEDANEIDRSSTAAVARSGSGTDVISGSLRRRRPDAGADPDADPDANPDTDPDSHANTNPDANSHADANTATGAGAGAAHGNGIGKRCRPPR
jgi:hypothetical protein